MLTRAQFDFDMSVPLNTSFSQLISVDYNRVIYSGVTHAQLGVPPKYGFILINVEFFGLKQFYRLSKPF